jgi:glycosyltransferase involved in cell wall biosynthesis
MDRTRLRILHLAIVAGETSAPYNLFCLPRRHERDITLCTYFRSTITQYPPEIRMLEGDGSLTGFRRVLARAMADGGYDIVHVHAQQMGVLLLLFGPRSSAGILASTVFTLHNSYQNYRLRNRLMLIPVFARFRRITCVGQVTAASIPRWLTALARDQVRPIPIGVSLDRVDRVLTATRGAETDADYTVASVGRLVAIKNPFAALEAFRQAGGGQRLLFVGDGDLRQTVEVRARECGLMERVQFSGLVPRDRVYELLGRSAVFVSTSWGEGLPVATLEAMACGCPVILSDIEPHREIANGTSFIPLVPPGDVAGFARELQRLYAMPAAERKRIGERCRRVVEERFSVAAMHRDYDALYQELLGAQATKPRAGEARATTRGA